MTANRARSGMTLLEVIVALTIAGAALAAGAAVLGFLSDQQSRTGAENIASASAVRSTLRTWLSETRLTTEGDAEFRGAPRRKLNALSSAMKDSSGEDELTFVTSAPTEIAPAGTQVHLYVQRSDSLPYRGLVAELTPWRRNGTPRIVSLVPNATRFQARYLGSVFGRRNWQESWVSTSVLPAAVELRVSVDTSAAAGADDDRAGRTLLVVPLMVTLVRR